MRNLRCRIVLIFGLWLAGESLWAQPELGICEQEEEEKAALQIPKVQKAWAAENFREAERYLNLALRLQADHAHALYLLGELNMRKGELRKAQFLWEKLRSQCPNYKAELDFFLGIMAVEAGELEQAISLLQSFLANQERDFGYDREAKTALEEARLRQKLISEAVDFDPQVLRDISTPAGEYLASISPDQEQMFFTRRSRKVNRRDGPAAQARIVEEFCLARRRADGQFEVGEPLPSPFNQNYNEGGPSITADNSQLYFTVCEDLNGYKNCDIFFSRKDPYGYWTTPRSVGDHINRRDSWESQPSVSANGDWLYFVSDREGGIGGLDLYRCYRAPGGEWGAPEALPKGVNTAKDEKAPFIHSDSETLYFTSDGHLGMGGLDIFFVKARRDSVWDKPQNMGYPINTEKDDLGLFVSLDGQQAYFASNSLRGPGDWDLFYFTVPDYARPVEVALIVGSLAEEGAVHQDFSEAEVEIKNLKTKEVTRLQVDKNTGNFAGVIQRPAERQKEDLLVSIQKKGAAFSSRYIAADELKKNAVARALLPLRELQIGEEYPLNDINFASNSFALNAVSEAVIEEFVRYMQNNPELRAEVQGHTDNVGDAASNLSLSRKRAQAVYQYAIAQGIASQRLTWNGYGSDRPIADNQSEAGRARNRRTVFVVTKK